MTESSTSVSLVPDAFGPDGRSMNMVALRAYESARRPSDSAVTPARTVFLLDQDPSLRLGLSNVLRSMAIDVREFASVPEFLAGPAPTVPSCLVAEIRPHGGSGLLLQQTLKSTPLASMPLIFVSGPCDVSTTVKAMKAGAWDFLEKPLRTQELIDSVVGALEHDEQRRNTERSREVVVARWHSLTRREKEVLAAVAKGRLSKQIAADLGIADITAKIHRSNGMRKMACRTVAELMTQLYAFELLQAEGPMGIRRPVSLTS